MDNFEFKAPMYVNFVQSSALDENDGADTFFGNDNIATYKFTHGRWIDIGVFHRSQKCRTSQSTITYIQKIS
jgi:hypothetical protein